jgi:hypothetical protein
MAEEQTLVVRKVNKAVYREFRAKALKQWMTVGRALSITMEEWVKAPTEKSKDPKLLLKAKPIDLGEGSEDISENVDEILYG